MIQARLKKDFLASEYPLHTLYRRHENTQVIGKSRLPLWRSGSVSTARLSAQKSLRILPNGESE